MPVDGDLIELLTSRDGRLTTVLLSDGQALQVLDIAWGYDMGDEYAHVTANCSPGAPGMSMDFFFTNDVVAVLDERGAQVFEA